MSASLLDESSGLVTDFLLLLALNMIGSLTLYAKSNTSICIY